jgi:hypothetical protein
MIARLLYPILTGKTRRAKQDGQNKTGKTRPEQDEHNQPGKTRQNQGREVMAVSERISAF